MVKRKQQNKTRRQNSSGSIYQRKDGRWAAAITLGVNENGVQKKKIVYGKSKIEVSKKLADLSNKIINVNYDYIENNTFKEIMKEWMLVFKKQLVSPRTFEHQLSKFNLHIAPQIGGMKIDEVSTIVIQKLLNRMLEKNLSLDVVRKTKNLLNQFFEYAISINLVSINPTLKAKVSSKDKKIYDGENEYKAMPKEIRDKFIAALDTHELLKPLCYAMLFGGLRSGEALALRWKNIDFENNIINVQNAITVVPKFDENGKVKERITVVGDTKTACSKRVVPMPEKLISVLLEYKNAQKQKAELENTIYTSDADFVFCNNDRTVRSYTGTRSIFNRFLKANNLENYNIHFHGLRHTYSNILFENNQNPKLIQNLLGHKSVKTTLVTYNSIDKSYHAKAVEVFNNEFKEETKDKKQKLHDMEDDDLDELLKMLEERKRKQKNDFEM